MVGSSSWLPAIVEGAISTCSVRPDVSMHQHALLWGPPMTPGSLAAGGFFAGSLITPSVMAPLVLTGMQCGLLSCSEGADPIGTWAVDSTYWAGGPWGAGPSVWGTCSEGAGVHSVHVVHGFS